MAIVLVTGSAGAIGRPVCAELRSKGHRVRGFDRVPTPDVDEAIIRNIEDRAAVEAAVSGTDAVVHLAARPDDAPFEQLVGPNVMGLFNLMNAARNSGVPRVVLASTVQVLWGVRPSGKHTGAESAPRNHYALTKVWAEHMGKMYSEAYGMSVIAARITWMARNVGEARHMVEKGATASYLSRRDVAQFMLRAIEATDVKFAVLYAVSAGGKDRYDLDAARDAIGYEPEDVWPSGFPFDLPDDLKPVS
jgi:uronate dehydrogenase